VYTAVLQRSVHRETAILLLAAVAAESKSCSCCGTAQQSNNASTVPGLCSNLKSCNYHCTDGAACAHLVLQTPVTVLLEQRCKTILQSSVVHSTALGSKATT
jgi:hypothetical protein